MSEKRSARERFEEYHAANPQVYVELERITREWVEAGNGRGSIQLFWEVLRWQSRTGQIETSEPFKFNDHFRPHYVRLLLANNPEWSDVFVTKELRAA